MIEKRPFICSGRPCSPQNLKKILNKISIQLSEVLLMKTKTIKTPSVGLILSESICAQWYAFGFKSTLLRHSHTTFHNHWCGSSPQKEKPRKPSADPKLVWVMPRCIRCSLEQQKQKKHYFSALPIFFSERSERGFASDDVFSCAATSDVVRAGAGSLLTSTAMTVARKLEELKHQQRGF